MVVSVSRNVSHSNTPLVPKIGVPFLDALQVVYGPPSLLGRFLLHIDHNLKKKGLTLDFATFEEAAEVNARNSDSWAFLNPMFDPATSAIPKDRTMCIAVRNADRQIVATAAGKLFDAADRTFRDVCESGDFLSMRPASERGRFDMRISAPIADQLSGQICFCGGIWVHPDTRGLRLPAMLSRIVNACMLTLWDPDYILGGVRFEVIGTDLYTRYGYKKGEPSLVFEKDGANVAEVMLLWMTREDALLDLAHFLDVLWPEIDTAVVPRRR